MPEKSHCGRNVIRFVARACIIITCAAALPACSERNDPTLSVSVQQPPHDSLTQLVSSFSFDLNIQYTGQAEKAEIYVAAYSGNTQTHPRMSVAGIGGFVDPPVPGFHIKPRLVVLDSEHSPLKTSLGPDGPDAGYRILSTVKHDDTVFGGGRKIIPRNALELHGMRSWGTFDNYDLSKDYIPIFYVKATRTGSMSARKPIRNGQLDLPDDVDCLIFYLKTTAP